MVLLALMESQRGLYTHVCGLRATASVNQT